MEEERKKVVRREPPLERVKYRKSMLREATEVALSSRRPTFSFPQFFKGPPPRVFHSFFLFKGRRRLSFSFYGEKKKKQASDFCSAAEVALSKQADPDQNEKTRRDRQASKREKTNAFFAPLSPAIERCSLASVALRRFKLSSS